jgi:hypothetical protein
MLNKNMGDKQQRKRNFLAQLLSFVLLGIVLHFFGK